LQEFVEFFGVFVSKVLLVLLHHRIGFVGFGPAQH
jgi:hypothetical protein